MHFLFSTVTLVSILFLIRIWCGHQPALSGTSVFKCGCIYGSLLAMQMRKYFPVTETALSSIKKRCLFVKLIYPDVPRKERAPPMKKPDLLRTNKTRKIGGLKSFQEDQGKLASPRRFFFKTTFFFKGSECVPFQVYIVEEPPVTFLLFHIGPEIS